MMIRGVALIAVLASSLLAAPLAAEAHGAQGRSNRLPVGQPASLARPGGNVTGLSMLTPELVGKYLELLKQAVPEVTRVAVLWQPVALDERIE